MYFRAERKKSIAKVAIQSTVCVLGQQYKLVFFVMLLSTVSDSIEYRSCSPAAETHEGDLTKASDRGEGRCSRREVPAPAAPKHRYASRQR